MGLALQSRVLFWVGNFCFVGSFFSLKWYFLLFFFLNWYVLVAFPFSVMVLFSLHCCLFGSSLFFFVLLHEWKYIVVENLEE